MSGRRVPGPDRDVRFEVYRSFIEAGRAPTVDALARKLGASRAGVEDALRRLAEDRALVLAPGSVEVWMAHPFSAVPTPFAVESRGRRWWANCAWDALAIPTLVGTGARIATSCPDCCEPLVLHAGIDGVEETGAVVHFAVPPKRFWENIGFT